MLRRVAPMVIAAASFAACGGAVDTLLLDDASDMDANVGIDDSVPDSGGGDAITPFDASVDATKPPKDSGPPYVDPGITCGTADCDASSQYCCVSITSYYPTYTYAFACGATSDLVQCPAGIPVYCDDDKECDAGQVCCGDLGNVTYSKVSCKPTCTGNVWGYQQVHFCDPKAPTCGTGTTCKASTVISGYYVCQ